MNRACLSKNARLHKSRRHGTSCLPADQTGIRQLKVNFFQMKKILPKNIKLRIRLFQRFIADGMHRYRSNFAESKNHQIDFKYAINLAHEIKKTHLYLNKIENIKLAGDKISKIIINPGEIFSFWRVVGSPTKENGFKKGRNIISGELNEDFGGGLCQLSSIIHHLAIIAGLKILERFNHTIDIYTNETRYTPLGTDATVVYGYKDLRIINNLSFPINFSFEINEDLFVANLKSTEQIIKKEIQFKHSESGNMIKVIALDQNHEMINKSYYKKLNINQ